MIFDKVWHLIYTGFLIIEQNWGIIKSIISLLGDVCLFFVTVYTFRLTILPKKLSWVEFRKLSSQFKGNSFEITLENRSLCPVVISSVELIFGSNKIDFFAGHCIVEGFKTQTIKMEPYSNILLNNEIMDIDFFPTQKMSLWIQTTRGLQHIKHVRYSKIIDYFKYKKYKKFAPTTVCRNKYNDKLIPQDIKYVLSFTDHTNKLQTVFIKKSGIMSENMFGCNSLPKKLVQNESKLRKYLDKEFAKHDLRCKLERFGEPLKQDE